MHKKLVKIAHVAPEICSWTDRQTGGESEWDFYSFGCLPITQSTASMAIQSTNEPGKSPTVARGTGSTVMD